MPTRGDLPVRFAPGIPKVPPIGPSTINADAYRDPDRFELEREQILNRSWQIICRSEQVANVGDFHVWTGHSESVVITRREDGTISGFHNVCPHRGARIVPESGTEARRFNCRWHNWKFDLDGNVTGVPNRPDFDPEALRDLCAPAIDVDEWGGWVWAVLAGPGAAGPLKDWIAPEVAADIGAYRMEDMILHDKVAWEVPVNWKICVEASSEYYHAQALHHMSADDARDSRHSTMHVYGRNGMYFVPFLGVLDELYETQDHTRLAIASYGLFPTSVANCQARHTQMFRAVPLAVDRTRFELWELRYPTDDPEYTRVANFFWEIYQSILEEDVQEWYDVAAVARSSAYKKSILSERECMLTHFHRVLDDMLAGGTGLGLEPEAYEAGEAETSLARNTVS